MKAEMRQILAQVVQAPRCRSTDAGVGRAPQATGSGWRCKGWAGPSHTLPAYIETIHEAGVMTLSAVPAAPEVTSGADGLAPLQFPPELKLTPVQFALVCAENREAVLELAADGSLVVMTPTGSETGARNTRLEMRLLLWADQHGGWKVFGSSSGFHLPDGSVLSPDASLVALDRWQALSAEQRRGFAPLCPDLVVELASPSDEGVRGIAALRRKMDAYQRNGARLGWLLLPEQRAVEVWPADGEPQRFNNLQLLEAGAPFQGLQLQMEEIWAA